MKIYVVGSTVFMHELVAIRDRLLAMGHEGWLHEDYDEYVKGTHPDLQKHLNPQKGEKAQIKIERDYLKVHYRNIMQSDAILVVNLTKNGIDNYIGGNGLIEMAQAYVHDKKIFLLNDIPTNLPYSDEIESMEPLCLRGDLVSLGSGLS